MLQDCKIINRHNYKLLYTELPSSSAIFHGFKPEQLLEILHRIQWSGNSRIRSEQWNSIEFHTIATKVPSANT